MAHKAGRHISSLVGARYMAYERNGVGTVAQNASPYMVDASTRFFLPEKVALYVAVEVVCGGGDRSVF